MLHGPLTDKDVVTEMMHNVIFSGSGVANMVYYTKNGKIIDHLTFIYHTFFLLTKVYP